MNNAMLSLVSADVRPACRDEPDLIKRIEKAFAKVQDFWMSTDDELRFRGALAAVFVETKDDGQAEHLRRSINALNSLNALIRGVPVNMEAVLDEMGDDPLPLMKLWHEAKAKTHA